MYYKNYGLYITPKITWSGISISLIFITTNIIYNNEKRKWFSNK